MKEDSAGIYAVMAFKNVNLITIVLFALLLMTQGVVRAEESRCGRLCDEYFWKNASEADVRIELERGADFGTQNLFGGLPLHIAAKWSSNPSAVAVLLDWGADLEARARHDMTPLHVAAASNSEGSILTLLLDRGADIEKRDSLLGWTPLYYAVASDRSWIVNLLLDRGANPKVRTEGGTTPFDWVQEGSALKNTGAYQRLKLAQEE